MLIPEPHLPLGWQEPPPLIERVIGEVVAAAARAIVRALMEYQNGGAQPATTRHGGDLIAQLYALRQACAGELDFDAVARSQGKRALRERYARLKHAPGRPVTELTDAMLDEMVAWPLNILGQVVRSQMN